MLPSKCTTGRVSLSRLCSIDCTALLFMCTVAINGDSDKGCI